MGLQDSIGAALVNDSFRDALAVTPNDTIAAPERLFDVRGIWADVAGTVSVITDYEAHKSEKLGSPVPLTSANAVSFTLLAGQVLKLAVAYVLATGTTATGIKALY